MSENQANNIQQVDYVSFDSRPLAQLKSQATPNGKKLITSEIVYLHTDHLNTPRTGTDTTDKVVWNWQSDAFGIKIPVAKQPNKVVVNLRFPGQYFDTETGLYYNYHRYYDPQTGRYISSDPIGLRGGLNTFGYVGGNPLRWTDPKGLVIPVAVAIEACAANPACIATVTAAVRKTVQMCIKAAVVAGGLWAAHNESDDEADYHGDRPKNQDFPEEAADSISKAQEKLKKRNKDRSDWDEDDEWGDKPRPKDANINSTGKSTNKNWTKLYK